MDAYLPALGLSADDSGEHDSSAVVLEDAKLLLAFDRISGALSG